MKVNYNGYTIECRRNDAWNGSFKGVTLSVFRKRTKQDTQNGKPYFWLTSGWFDGLVKDGIKTGKLLVDKYIESHNKIN